MSNFFANNNSTDFTDFIGETVTIFTQSGGESGEGFTGVVLSANSCVVRLVTSFGSPPDNVFGHNRGCCGCGRRNRFGSVVDIPVEKIVAFVHNAV